MPGKKSSKADSAASAENTRKITRPKNPLSVRRARRRIGIVRMSVLAVVVGFVTGTE